MVSEGDTVAQRHANALGAPLLGFLEISAVDEQDPGAGVSMALTRNVLNAAEALHAGAISTILEIAAYLALLPDLGAEEEAVSHGLYVSYVARAEAEPRLIASGRVLRRTRRIAFVAAELRQEQRLLAMAQVTKSIYTLPTSA